MAFKEKLKEDLKKSAPIIFGGIFGSIFTLMFLMLALNILDTNIVGGFHFKLIEKKVSNDPNLNMIAELCDSHKEEFNKVKCIVNYYSDHYNYTWRVDTKIRDATDFLEKGGLCRDFAINVCATIEKLDISCNYILTKDHVFPIIQFGNESDYYYCTYDADWFCTKKELDLTLVAEG